MTEGECAHVRIWAEESGNAGLSARQMPAPDAVIAWSNIERRALDLHAAGVAGTAGQLQVQAMTDFLLGRAVPAHSACQGAQPGDEGARHSTHAGQGAHRDLAPLCRRTIR